MENSNSTETALLDNVLVKSIEELLVQKRSKEFQDKKEPALNDVLRLNVGGKIYMTTRATLCSDDDSMLALMFQPASNFAPPAQEDGSVFLDRNPATFEYILDYLRNGCCLVGPPPSELLQLLCADADFFGLIRLKAACDVLVEKAEKVAKSVFFHYERGVCDIAQMNAAEWKDYRAVGVLQAPSEFSRAKVVLEKLVKTCERQPSPD